MVLEHRDSGAPETSSTGAQRQLTQRSSPEMWGRLVSEAMSLPGVVEGHSAVSPASSRALFLSEIRDVATPETSLASSIDRLEAAHIHAVDDTSLHLCLPRQRAAEAIGTGWAIPHQYGDFGTELLIFGPRDGRELGVILALIQESLDFARAKN